MPAPDFIEELRDIEERIKCIETDYPATPFMRDIRIKASAIGRSVNLDLDVDIAKYELRDTGIADFVKWAKDMVRMLRGGIARLEGRAIEKVVPSGVTLSCSNQGTGDTECGRCVLCQRL